MWTGGPGGIWIISPAGKHLGTILTPERISNLAFGDADGKTIYATGPTQLFRFRVNVAGPAAVTLFFNFVPSPRA